jgi:hypothetical protein
VRFLTFGTKFKTLPQLKGLRGDKVEITEQKRLGVGGPANMMFLEICRLLHDYHVARQEPCCILVFLSGISGELRQILAFSFFLKKKGDKKKSMLCGSISKRWKTRTEL